MTTSQSVVLHLRHSRGPTTTHDQRVRDHRSRTAFQRSRPDRLHKIGSRAPLGPQNSTQSLLRTIPISDAGDKAPQTNTRFEPLPSLSEVVGAVLAVRLRPILCPCLLSGRREDHPQPFIAVDHPILHV